MKIRIITCDETVFSPRDVALLQHAACFDDGYRHKTQVLREAVNYIRLREQHGAEKTILFDRDGTIISYLGEQISKKAIAVTDVEVELFTHKGSSLHSLDSSGFLLNWRYGALEADFDAVLEAA